MMNVIDMLNGIIGKDKDDEKDKKRDKSPKKSSKKSRHKSKSPKSNNSSPERLKTEVLLSIKNKQKIREAAGEDKPKVNYTYYDPELHWCKVCNLFPKTAKDYLTHLHSKEHEEKQTMKTAPEMPWREDFTAKADLAPNFPDAPTKRTPIRGLQFFVPSSAWFCKLCSIWMGDLHCASVHLKTETHAQMYNKHTAENSNFEVDWMTKRSHAYELYREKEGESVLRLAPFDQIPLTLLTNPAPVINKVDTEVKRKKDDKKIKKKKTKKDDKKDRKKKRRSKKKKHGSSSSSSDDSDSDDSDSSSSSADDKKDDKVDTKNSIRVAMRNFLDMKQKKEEKVVEPAGKWTVVSSKPKQKPIPPPAPAFSESSIKEKKRDDLILQQWTPADPIISSDERKLLEKLKGRLKTNQTRAEEKKQEERISEDRSKRTVSHSRSKDRSRSRSRDRYRGDRDRNYRRRNSRSRSSSRSYSRRSRSRSRSHNRYRSYRGRSRSRSRGRRVEKAIVRFPPEPQLPPLREERKSKPYSSRKDEKKTDKTSGSKKLPFIGRMPVFKKLESDSKKSESEMMDIVQVEEPVAVPQEENPEPVEGMQECFDDEMDLMPDPLQFNAMFGAPPPPPIQDDKNQEEILPPGIDDAESEFIPKPISDAPVPRKGPLPKDFQDTLNLLFDGNTPKPIQFPEPKPEPVVVIEAPPPIDNDQPTFVNMSDDELSQHYGGQYSNHNSNHSNQQFFNQVDAPPLPAEPKKAPEIQKKEEIVQSAKETPKIPEKKVNGKGDIPNSNRYEMDAMDLAMLGIDVDDFL